MRKDTSNKFIDNLIAAQFVMNTTEEYILNMPYFRYKRIQEFLEKQTKSKSKKVEKHGHIFGR